ncbi:MAG: hypothetical protein H8E44_08085 [Planctomycetes bacterium]|nr:hypothetical protein [Planctomycetota bacterium]
MRRTILFALLLVTLCTRNPSAAEPVGLEMRKIVDDWVADTGVPVPSEALRVFVYEGAPRSVHVSGRFIAVVYDNSGVLFDRASGRPVRRYTVADRWPEVRPIPFGPTPVGGIHRTLVGPGALEVRRPYSQDADGRATPDVAAFAHFNDATWHALQPRRFLNIVWRARDHGERRKRYGSWTAILQKLNAASYVEANFGRGAPPKRFTIEDGLASNIVTHFAVAGGSLWAACVDIYDPEREQWGPGGLCRFNSKTSRWERIDSIDGRQVRWVTFLETVDDELWIGFREGSGMAGDRIVYGMGLYPGIYRPVTKSVVLARLSGGEWTGFARPPLPEEARVDVHSVSEPTHTPTETPRKLARVGESVLLFSQTRSRRLSGNWDIELDGQVSRLDLATGKWTIFDATKDLDADVLTDLVFDEGEVVVTSNRGVHRWVDRERSWQLLDPKCDLPNPALSAAVPVGSDLWVGYTNQSFGVLGQQGISRFDERSGRWSYISPDEIGTNCPVRRMTVLPGDEVWVLFQQRPWFGAAVEFAYYPREKYGPDGIGRYADGKWEFPVKLNGVPKTITREYKGPNGIQRWEQPAPIQQLVGLGSRLFVASDAGVYVGPKPWRQILEGRVLAIEPSADGKTLVMIREDAETRQSDKPMMQRCLYDPATSKVAVEKVPAQGTDWWSMARRGDLLHWGDDETRLAGPWVKLPIAGLDDRAIGPLGGGYHKVVETTAALWIASGGQLIRLDRRWLTQ